MRCILCGDIIESSFIHDVKHCRCGRVGYLKRTFENGNDYNELSAYEEMSNDE